MNDLSLHIMDIMQNSVRAGASSIDLAVEEDVRNDLLTITISDNGCGMTAEQVEKLSDPFYTSRTTRRIGMGIPLLRQSAEQSGGSLAIRSKPGQGTTVAASFGLTHIDRPPLGDLANSFILTVASKPELEYTLTYKADSGTYRFDTREVKEVLDGVPLNEPGIIRMLTEMVEVNLDEIKSI